MRLFHISRLLHPRLVIVKSSAFLRPSLIRQFCTHKKPKGKVEKNSSLLFLLAREKKECAGHPRACSSHPLIGPLLPSHTHTLLPSLCSDRSLIGASFLSIDSIKCILHPIHSFPFFLFLFPFPIPIPIPFSFSFSFSFPSPSNVTRHVVTKYSVSSIGLKIA